MGGRVPLSRKLTKLRELRRKIDAVGITSPTGAQLHGEMSKTLTEILIARIGSRADAYTVLQAIIMCGTFERPIRRALMNLLRFLGAH